MPTVYKHDLQWFLLHPTTYRYQRPPLPTEWPNLDVPPDAVVTVYLINARCTVRVLAVPGTPRLAESIDTDSHYTVVSPRRSLTARMPPHMWG
jgi:hypothetical protein